MDQKVINNRLKRIEGQVRGVENMVAENREFNEVVTQLQAIRSALSGLIMVLVEDRLTAGEQGLSITPDDAALMLRLLKS
jgi:DNA-binding FrmR family transcriptional regulator